MPGKQDPEYFPLNFNVRLYDYDDGHPLIINRLGNEHLCGKYEGSDNGSGCESTTRRTRNVSLNEVAMPPENSEVEDDEDDSVSVQSSDIDVDLDDMDTLVLSIRDKLHMDSNYATSSNFWEDEDSSHSSCSASSSRCSINRRRRIRPLSWKRNQSSRLHSLATIQKHGNRSTHCRHWLQPSKSFSDVTQNRRGKSNPDSPHNDPYEILQELLESGGLIKEAVRRINTKRLGYRTNNNGTSHHQLGSVLNSTAKLFAYRDENSEISYPSLPLSAQ